MSAFEIGKKVLIVSDDALYSQEDSKNPLIIQEIEVLVKVTGKGEFSGKEYEGFLAKGADGYMYGYNYPHANEGYGNTPWVRHMPDAEFLALSEEAKNALIERLYWPSIRSVRTNKLPDILVGNPLINYCEKHASLSNAGKECFFCRNDIKGKKDVKGIFDYDMEIIYKSLDK